MHQAAGFDVTFSPPDAALVQGTLTIDVKDEGVPGQPSLPGFPWSLPLEGNVVGIGPNTIKIVGIVPDPPGADLTIPGERVSLANVSPNTLKLDGCRVGDYAFRTNSVTGSVVRLGPRPIKFFQPGEATLKPFDVITGTGDVLTIWTGRGPVRNTLNVWLERAAPVWNNTGDTAWITNANGQLIDTLTYVTPASPVQPPDAVTITNPPRTPVTMSGGGTSARVFLNGRDPWIDTGIPIEDGDVITFTATGRIWVSWIVFQGESTPAGRAETADSDWPLPGSPSCGLIGKIGDGGDVFFVGSSATRTVNGLDHPATLFLGINDIKTDDNWGSGYTCTVTIVR